MAETLLWFGVEKLWDLIVRESDRFHGVKEQFDELKSDLNMLRCFLEDADAKKHASAMVRNTMKEIKEIVHDAEDIVETFLLEEELGNSCGIRNSARKFSCGVFERRGLAFSIEAISKRISKVIRDMQSLGVQQENVKNVVGYLMEEDSVQVVSITGMGGIGKTTLAREDLRGYVFPNSLQGILLTSRNEGVAVRADPSCFTFKPDCLTLEESWILFRRIAFPIENTNEYKVDEEMEEMGKQMIKHCGGLPLAVKVLGGLLASQYTLREWKRIHENIRSYIVGGTSFEEKNINSVYHVLYLSFEKLPIYLKHCFLYLAHFPEDYAIDVGKLSYYWAAEGIPRPRYYDGATIQEVADGFIAELVKRNMVISERDFRTSRFETCQLHDMMREVCLHKAREENFVHIVDLGTSIATSQSLSSRSSYSLLTLNFMWRMRSCTIGWHQFMRVLDLSGAKFEGGKLPPGIGKLIHLRYLSLHRAWICHLPSSIQDLKFLLYLSLDVDCRYQVYMSDFLKELRKLRYLSLPRELQDGTNVTDLHSMTSLRGLSIIFNGDCTLEALSSSLGQLKHLENFNLR
ncbi:hypothetical protein HID58_033133 [Brassica napus]|uniref:Disease resistance protein n=1 Tax=Brassica napus TaxID=3708 RepID=A0ABQ8BYC5_BRANA|nr:hypothetical protein HID58_033133 [Brassica napus]